MNRLVPVCAAVIILLGLATAGATDFYVSPDGSDQNNGQAPGSAWRTITHAVDWISDHAPGAPGNPAVINVAAGTYTSAFGELFPIIITNDAVNIEIRGAGPDNTIIDGEGNTGRAFVIECYLDRFTLAATRVTGFQGTIICYSINEAFTIDQCRFDGFTYNWNGFSYSSVYLNNPTGTVTITDTEFDGPFSSSDGGALNAYWALNADFVIDGVSITNARAWWDGGGIYIYGAMDVSISDLYAYGCAAYYGYGGAVLVNSPDELTVEQSVFEADTSAYGGGALYALWPYEELTISNVTATDCVVEDGSGGAIRISKPSTGTGTTISNVSIQNCTAEEWWLWGGGGGGIRYYGEGFNGPLTISDVTIGDCYTNNSGGGMEILNANEGLTMEDVSIFNSVAGWAGGGISMVNLPNTETRLNRVTVSGCEAQFDVGGGIRIEGLYPDSLIATHLNLCDNTSYDGGGGMYIGGGDVRISDFSVQGNSSSGFTPYWGFGALKFYAMNSLVLTDGIFSQNTAGYAGMNGAAGGGLSCFDIYGMYMKNVIFIENTSFGHGGGMYFNFYNCHVDSLVMNDVTFEDNSAAAGDGGGALITSGLWFSNYSGDEFRLRNILFSGNESYVDGGGMELIRVSPDLVNITMADNSAEGEADALAIWTPEYDVNMYNSIIWSNGSSNGDQTTWESWGMGTINFSYSNVEWDGGEVAPGTGNINQNPLYNDPESGDYGLMVGSPSIDRGMPYNPAQPYSDGSHEPGWMEVDTVLVVPDSGAVTIIINDRIDQGFWDNIDGPEPEYVVCDIPGYGGGGNGNAGNTLGKMVLRDRYMLLGVPLVPDESNNQQHPQYAFGDDMFGKTPLYQWSPDTLLQTWRLSRYVNHYEAPGHGLPDDIFTGYLRFAEMEKYNGEYMEIADPPLLKPGLGYYFVYNHGVQENVDSVIVDVSKWALPYEPYDLALESATASGDAWNMMADPWPTPINWAEIQFSTDSLNWVASSVASDPEHDWVNGYVYTLDHVTGDFVTVTGQIEPWEGFWLVVKTTDPLWIRFNPGESAPNALAFDLNELDEMLDWGLMVTARRTDKLQVDYYNMIGVGDDFTDGEDGMDALQVTSPNSEYIMLRSRPVTDDGEATSRLTFDFRANDLEQEGYKAWLMELWYYHDSVKYGDAAQPIDVRIQWPTVSRVPEDVNLSIFGYSETFGNPNVAAPFDPEIEPLLVESLRDEDEFILTVDDVHSSSWRKKRFWLVASLDGVIFARDVDSPEELPTETVLRSISPNPFNPVTTVRFDVASEGLVRIRIFNMLGRQVDVLTDRNYSPGRYSLSWNAGRLATGVYFVRFETSGDVARIRKIVLIR